MFVLGEVFQTVVLFVVMTISPLAPKSIVLAFELFEVNLPTVTTLLLRAIVPAVNAKNPLLGASVGLPEKLKVMSDLLTVVLSATAVAATVTTADVPELESKITVSALFGGPLPPAPPLVVDQFAVETLFHVPEPPTQ
jgi:hypothetical protein